MFVVIVRFASGTLNSSTAPIMEMMRMINIYKDAGQRIFLIRTMRGYTREYLAEAADISAKFLYEIENGKKGFSAVVLYRICKVLEVGCDYIMSGKGDVVEYDHKLLGILEMFENEQTEKIGVILKEIYELTYR